MILRKTPHEKEIGFHEEYPYNRKGTKYLITVKFSSEAAPDFFMTEAESHIVLHLSEYQMLQLWLVYFVWWVFWLVDFCVRSWTFYDVMGKSEWCLHIL